MVHTRDQPFVDVRDTSGIVLFLNNRIDLDQQGGGQKVGEFYASTNL